MRPRIYPIEPEREFLLALLYGRSALTAAFDAALEAHAQARAAEGSLTGGIKASLYYQVEAIERGYDAPSLQRLNEHADDIQAHREMLASCEATANILAAAVILVLDDLLQRFAAKAGLTSSGLDLCFGATFNGVQLTSLLHAAGNNFRHGRAWGDVPQHDQARPRSWHDKRALSSIKVLTTALNIRDPIWGHVTQEVLVVLAGNVGSGRPEYQRLETAVVEAAHEIAGAAGGDHLERFVAALTIIYRG